MDGFSVESLNIRDLNPQELTTKLSPMPAVSRVVGPYEKFALRMAYIDPVRIGNTGTFRVGELILVPYNFASCSGFSGIANYLEEYGSSVEKTLFFDDEMLAARVEAQPDIAKQFVCLSPLNRQIESADDLADVVRRFCEDKKKTANGKNPPLILVILEARRLVHFLARFASFPVPPRLRAYSEIIYFPGEPEPIRDHQSQEEYEQ